MLRNQLQATVTAEATEESERFMLGASKILTVSYGTFSCTLEGFDDPFSTMKGIAEYFRDLAADDRYFGAEPPTPDAAMLQHIAEREIQRRVEAKINANGVVLRQTEQPQKDPVPLSAPVAEASAANPVEVASPVGAVVPTAVPVAPSDMPDGDVVDAGPDLSDIVVAPQADDDSVSAKLARIRAAVAASRIAVVADESAAAYEDDGLPVADVGPSQDFAFDLDLSNEAPVAEAVAESAIDLEVYAEGSAQRDTPDEDAIADDFAVLTAEDRPDADSADEIPESDMTDLAALDGATMAEVGAPAADLPQLAEADDARAHDSDAANYDGPTEVLTSDDALMSSLASLTGEAPVLPEMTDAETEPSGTEALETAMDDTIAGLFADADAEATVDDDMSLPEAAQAEVAETDDLHLPEADEDEDEDNYEDQDRDNDAADPALAAMFDAADESDADAVTAEIHAEEMPVSEDDAVAGLFPASDDDATDTADMHDAEAAEEPAPRPGFLQRARARVIKVRASEFIPDDATSDPVATELRADGLSADEEADLIAELERAERDAEGEGEGGRAILENSGTDNEAAVSRLMDEANTKLEGAESRRRFSAIAHLKAAVAATVADRKMKSKDAPPEVRPADDDVTDRYRDDLSKAVRPRRPSADAGTMTQRPSMDTRPAPLVLVSEQRIDRTSGQADAGVIRPRRISAAALSTPDDDADQDQDEEIVLSPEDARNFADFAEKLGASNLAELLEAAAAYTSTVEGRPHFSRPQILSKVANVADDDDYTREDGLRSFGMLLRQGKIQKVRRGQFMIADSSKFMTEARRAAR